MADIPTSNKPSSNLPAKAEKKAEKKKEEEEKKDITSTPEFQKKVKDMITEVKGILDVTNNEMVKTENFKLDNVHKIGLQLNKLVNELGSRERSTIVEQFHRETGMDKSWFYRAMTCANLLTKEDMAKLKKNGVTVRALYAILAGKNPELQKKMIERALSQGITDEEVRSQRGVKGINSAKFAKKRRDADKKKPPIRVFTQGFDRLNMLEESIGSCTDAVGRLAECKSEEERKEAIKVLIEIRKKAPDVAGQIASFMKFTATFSK